LLVPNGGKVRESSGAIDGGTNGHIRGAHIGGKSNELEQIA